MRTTLALDDNLLAEAQRCADIDDGDPELGEYSPWSWWPIVLAASAAIAAVGLAVGTWMLPIGFAVFAIAIVAVAAAVFLIDIFYPLIDPRVKLR